MRREREGELLMVFISILESLFPIISICSIVLIGAIYSYAYILVIATIILTSLLIYKKEWRSLFNPHAQKDLLLTSLFITALFLLLFLSLRYTTAGNVAVLVFMQLFFSYLYFNLFGSEKMRTLHLAGAAFMGIGAVLMLMPDELSFNLGDALALSAAAVAPLANLYQKRARQYVSTITILTYRNILAIPVIFAAAFVFEPTPASDALIQALPYLLANGILVYVFAKIFWVEALHRISITKMSAMLALIPLFTLIFARVFLDEVPEVRQMIGIVPILIGGYLITKRA
jgi:drug/metabolite transporter (DMT)-like permease